jgi:hypothetical protein
MRFAIRARNGRYFWRLYDHRDKLVARSIKGYRSYVLCRDYARYTWEGLRNCLR